MPISHYRVWIYRRIFLALRPKSFAGLILAALALVAIPLTVPLVYSVVSINQVSKQGRQAVYRAEKVARCSKILLDQTTAMERSFRMSLILSDTSVLDRYYQGHQRFREAVGELSTVQLSEPQTRILMAMDAAESEIFGQIERSSASGHDPELSYVNFAPLLKAAHSLLPEGNASIRQEVDAMQERADHANSAVIWLVAGVVPLAVVLALGFSGLITRPIRQIDEAIRSMGGGELSEAVEIDGPQDLRQLADRLNWMRLSLLEIEKQKTTFLQHVSHELKTPLTSIREGADLLSEGIAGKLTPKQMEIATILFANSVELQKRIEDLLAFNALQTGKVVLNTQKVMLRNILDAVMQDHYLALHNKSLKVDLQCPDVMIEADAQKLRIIVDNLMSNAIKYSSDGGIIKIYATRAEGCVQMDVIDYGAGIDPGDREMIFEAFYQGRKMPQGHTKGTGLGLSIAREYVLAHGGSIKLAEVPKGTCFRVVLPLNLPVTAA